MVLWSILLCGLALTTAMWWMLHVPGGKGSRSPQPLTSEESELRDQLRRDVEFLAGTIGERNIPHRSRELEQAAAFIEESWTKAGFTARSHWYRVAGIPCRNIEVEIPGASRPRDIVVIGAHYDTVPGTPGADDNTSGVAAVLALSRQFIHTRPERTLRFLAFVNEEPPYFWTSEMGSLVYAKECRQRGERIEAMISVESVGYYDDAPSSQKYPLGLRAFYPSAGNFVAFVGNLGSRQLVKQAHASFCRSAALPSQGAILPGFVPGIGWSDHWSFWQAGYPAIQVTDTALFRNPHYHIPSDTPEKLDYDRLARFTVAMRDVVQELASPER
jgi:hypothetical protein